MEFGLLMTDIPVYISCKCVMYIFKIDLVISETVRIAFLYVLSIYTMFMLHLNCLRESGNVTSYTAETCFMRGKQQT